MNKLELKIPPPIAAILFGVVMWGTTLLSPDFKFDGLWRVPLACALALFGGGVAAMGFRAFGQAKTTVSPTNPTDASSLVTSGIYRYTRNPMYLGLSALLLAWAVYLAVPWVLIGPVLFVAFITRFQILPEERVLTTIFGAQYVEYCHRIRRWL